jgi:hypothetical protein
LAGHFIQAPKGEDMAKKPEVKLGKTAYYVDWGTNRVHFFKGGGLMIRKTPKG